MKRSRFLKSLGLLIPGAVVAPSAVERLCRDLGRKRPRRRSTNVTASEFADLLEPKLKEIWEQKHSNMTGRAGFADVFREDE